MLTMKYEIYVNDYQRKFVELFFPFWESVENWMFSQMILDPRENMLFDEDDSFVWKLKPEEGKPILIIHELLSDNGIVFSDGHFTGGKTFCAKKIREHLDKCIQRRDGDYNFVEYDEDK